METVHIDETALTLDEKVNGGFFYSILGYVEAGHNVEVVHNVKVVLNEEEVLNVGVNNDEAIQIGTEAVHIDKATLTVDGKSIVQIVSEAVHNDGVHNDVDVQNVDVHNVEAIFNVCKSVHNVEVVQSLDGKGFDVVSDFISEQIDGLVTQFGYCIEMDIRGSRSEISIRNSLLVSLWKVQAMRYSAV